MKEKTLSIIKPDGVSRNLIGEVIKRLEEADLNIVAMKMLQMNKEQAKGFYKVHEGKPFYDSVTDFMSSGPCIVMVLEGDDAISRYRKLMGATDYKKAEEGTIRRVFAQDMLVNVFNAQDTAALCVEAIHAAGSHDPGPKAEQIEAPRFRFQVCEVDNELAAFYALEIQSETDAELEALFVKPDYIGRGIGTLLVDHVKSEARLLGIHTVTIQGDPNADDFYRDGDDHDRHERDPGPQRGWGRTPSPPRFRMLSWRARS